MLTLALPDDLRPLQHPHAHGNTNGHVYTTEETFEAFRDRPRLLVALRAARWQKIGNNCPKRRWYSADTRLLRIHGLLKFVSRRLDCVDILAITPKGRSFLGSIERSACAN